MLREVSGVSWRRGASPIRSGTSPEGRPTGCAEPSTPSERWAHRCRRGDLRAVVYGPARSGAPADSRREDVGYTRPDRREPHHHEPRRAAGGAGRDAGAGLSGHLRRGTRILRSTARLRVLLGTSDIPGLVGALPEVGNRAPFYATIVVHVRGPLLCVPRAVVVSESDDEVQIGVFYGLPNGVAGSGDVAVDCAPGGAVTGSVLIPGAAGVAGRRANGSRLSTGLLSARSRFLETSPSGRRGRLCGGLCTADEARGRAALRSAACRTSGHPVSCPPVPLLAPLS